ncbi:MAG: SEC59/DGK1/VTE5 family protein [Ignavibacteria bacterium]|nr:SEC59/DGK1/VTE5 family protein [Ignavibacteria bacterium]
MNGLPDVERDYRGELVRKGIHLCSLSIPIGYALLGRSTVLSILIPVTLLFLMTDLARLFSPPFREFYHSTFGWLMREHERGPGRRNLNGASYVLVAACICILVFPMIIAITAFSILIVSDTAAALVGRRFGKRKFLAKSVEGSLGFFLSAVVVVLLSPKAGLGWTEYLIGATGAAAGTVVEALPIALDDNLTIPLSVGVVMYLLYLMLFPSASFY